MLYEVITKGDIVAATDRDAMVAGYHGLSRTTLVQTRALTLEANQA